MLKGIQQNILIVSILFLHLPLCLQAQDDDSPHASIQLPQQWQSRRIAPAPGQLPTVDAAALQTPALPDHIVRIGYLIPIDREPQPDAAQRLRYLALLLQSFYRDYMERWGFGPKTFILETEADGITPKIHFAHTQQRADYFRLEDEEEAFARVTAAMNQAGYPVWSDGQIWILTVESHIMNPDGSVEGLINLGDQVLKASGGGAGMSASNALALLDPDYLLDDRDYHGMVIPELGPYPMVYNVTAQDYQGITLSKLSSSWQGTFLHEMGHGFGLFHDIRNDRSIFREGKDRKSQGNYMGLGLRGLRGYIHPQRYPDVMRLAHSNALVLNYSRYLNAGKTFTDNSKPSVEIHTSGFARPVNGLLQIEFTAADDNELAFALMEIEESPDNPHVIGDMLLDGNKQDAVFRTPYFSTDKNALFRITVYDVEGNFGEVDSLVRALPPDNLLPRPEIIVQPDTAYPGEMMTFDASHTPDFDGPFPLEAEWDFDGDGIFDTAPSTELIMNRQFSEPGVRIIRARISDAAGGQVVSDPVAIRILKNPLTTTVRDPYWNIYR